MKTKINTFIFILISTLFTINVQAATNDYNCYPAASMGSKIGNFNEADVNNVSVNSLRPCSIFLLKKDNVALSNLDLVADEKSIQDYQGVMTNLGLDYDYVYSNLSNKTSLIDIVILIATYFTANAITLFLTYFIIKSLMVHTFENKYAFNLLAILCLCFIIFNAESVAIIFAIYGTSYYRFFAMYFANFSGLEDLQDINGGDYVNKISKHSLDLSNQLTYVEAINTSTIMSKRRTNFGKKLEIDTDFTKSIFNINNPTFAEYEDYRSQCEQTNFVEVKKSSNVNIASFDFTRLSTNANFVNTNDTVDYDCNEHYGNEVEILNIQNNILDITKNFLQNFTKTNMSNDLTLKENIKTIFNSKIGSIIENLEDVEKDSVKNINLLSQHILIAQSAIESSRKNGTDVKDSSEYNALYSMIKTNYGDTLDFESDEIMTSTETLFILFSYAFHYNFTELFGLHNGYDDVVDDKKNIGYLEIKPFISRTVELAMQLDCAKTRGSQKSFEVREEYANHYNNLDPSKKNFLIGGFGMGEQAACYNWNDDGTITAVAYKDDITDLENEINDRSKALKLLFDIKNKVALSVIMDSEKINNDFILEALNSFEPTFYGALNSYITLTSVKQKMKTSVSSIGDLYSFSNQLNFDTSRPATYFNYLSGGAETDDQIKNLDKTLYRYDLSILFDTNNNDYNDKIGNEDNIDESFSASMIYNDCPLKNSDGDCKGSIIENISSSKNHFFTQTMTFAGIKYGSKIASGFCSKSKSSNDNSVEVGASSLIKKSPVGAVACGLFTSIAVVSDMLLTPMILISGIITLLCQIVVMSPLLIDIIAHFAIIDLFLIIIVVASVFFSMFLIINIIKDIPTFQDKNTFNNLFNFDSVFDVIKNMFITIIMFFVSIITLLLIITNEIVGGAIFDLINKFYSGDLISAIIISYASIIIFLILFYYIAKICFGFKEIVKSLWTKESASNSGGGGVFGGMLIGSSIERIINNARTLQYSTDNTTNKLSQSISNKKSEIVDKINNKRELEEKAKDLKKQVSVNKKVIPNSEEPINKSESKKEESSFDKEENQTKKIKNETIKTIKEVDDDKK